MNTTKFMGYDKDTSGNLIINEEQAEVVRLIYEKFLSGRNYFAIARELNEAKLHGWNGESKWIASTIETMLKNEKYKGDALLQKTYTVDFLTKKREKNNGQIAQYYVETNHPAIIESAIWEAVQIEKERRRTFMAEHNIKAYSSNIENNPLASKVICGECGEAFGRKKWITREGEKRSVWQCNARYKVKGVRGCSNRHIEEVTLEKIFVEAWSTLIADKERYQIKWKRLMEDKNQLVAYQAKTLLEYNEKDVKVFDAGQMHETLESITVYEIGRIVLRFFDGTEVEIG